MEQKTEQITVREAFQKYGTIELLHYYECWCSHCHGYYEEYLEDDEDTSFYGTIEEFPHFTEGFVSIDMDTVIYPLGGNSFKFYSGKSYDELCFDCRKLSFEELYPECLPEGWNE